MEKRCCERRPFTLEVVIGYRSLGLVRAKTCDISLGGMSVDTGRISLPIQAPVEINFQLKTEEGLRECKAHAMVVHHSGESVGLMFDGMSSDTHRALKQLVSDWQVFDSPAQAQGLHPVAAM